jgi:hypothetical protein
MNHNHKSSLKYSELYESTLEEVIQGNVDLDIMNMALIRSSWNQDKAQALYIMFVVNGEWPEVRIKQNSKYTDNN